MLFNNKFFNKNLRTRGRKITLDLSPASLEIKKLDKAERLIYPLEDAKLNNYTPTVKIGDKITKGLEIATAENAHGLKILSSFDGTVEAIETVKAPLPQKTCQALIIKPENSQYTFEDVLFNQGVLLSEYPKEMIFEKIVKANIQGLGGGLFLSAKKILSSDKIKHIILNAVECEPVLNCDEALLTNYLAEVLAGGIFLQTVANAQTITIVVKEHKTELIEHIKHFTKNNPQFANIAVATVPNTYPAGAANEILRYVFNKNLTPNQHATEHGFLMQNVMTAVSIFRAVTCNLPQLERIVSVFGKDINNPANILVPIGATIEDILRFLEIDKPTSIRCGGIMMGEDILADDSIKHTALLKSSNAIILNNSKEKIVSPCINCGECVTACPVNLVPTKMFKAAKFNNFDSPYLDNLATCMTCGLCDLVCPSNIPLSDMFKYAKQEKKQIATDKVRAEYIGQLTEKKAKRIKAEKAERDRIKQERKLARQARLAKKKEQENVE